MCNKFVTGVKIKATWESKVNGRPDVDQKHVLSIHRCSFRVRRKIGQIHED